MWRTVLEGALLEARAGNNAVARKVFKVSRQATALPPGQTWWHQASEG